MTDNRQSNDTQFERLISSIESLRMHLGELPEQLAGRLRGEIEAVGLGAGRGAQEGGIYFPPTPRAASAPLLHAEHNHEDQQQPVMDEDNGSNAGSTLVDHLEAQAQADAEQAAQGTTRGGVRFGINPLSSFAQLDKRMADSGDVDGKVGRKGSIGKKGMRGPRMPGMAGLKMWGELARLALFRLKTHADSSLQVVPRPCLPPSTPFAGEEVLAPSPLRAIRRRSTRH